MVTAEDDTRLLEAHLAIGTVLTQLGKEERT